MGTATVKSESSDKPLSLGTLSSDLMRYLSLYFDGDNCYAMLYVNKAWFDHILRYSLDKLPSAVHSAVLHHNFIGPSFRTVDTLLNTSSYRATLLSISPRDRKCMRNFIRFTSLYLKILTEFLMAQEDDVPKDSKSKHLALFRSSFYPSIKRYSPNLLTPKLREQICFYIELPPPPGKSCTIS